VTHRGPRVAGRNGPIDAGGRGITKNSSEVYLSEGILESDQPSTNKSDTRISKIMSLRHKADPTQVQKEGPPTVEKIAGAEREKDLATLYQFDIEVLKEEIAGSLPSMTRSRARRRADQARRGTKTTAFVNDVGLGLRPQNALVERS